ncbi:MAG: transglutaminase domain-containing protein [Actinobacteria bacterium]|nr:transglutaminase domain-containing protein [Actinomycetota bacterium]
MTRQDTRNRGSRIQQTQLPATICLVALTMATAVSMCRIFPDWEYLRPMLVVAVGTHLAAALMRLLRAPFWLAAPIVLFIGVDLLAIVFYRNTLNGPFPGSRTIELMRIEFSLVLDQFPTTIAPVPSHGNYAIATTAAIAMCAFLSDTFAFRALGRLEAIVPTAVMFIFVAVLGTDRHRESVAALWIGTAFIAVAALRVRHVDDEGSWMGSRRWGVVAAMPAILVSVGLTTAAAAAVAPRLPGAGAEALIDTRNRGGSVTEVLSPLVDIRAQLVNRSNLELFTVGSSDGGHYWRMVGLPIFDGTRWDPPEEDLESMGYRASEVVLSSAVTTQDITVVELGGHLVPAAYTPILVSEDSIYWADDSDSLVLADSVLQAGDRIQIRSMVPRPSEELLRASPTDNAPGAVYYELPDGFPDVARDAAEFTTRDAPTTFDKMIALQNWFRTEFEYDLDVQSGNSNDAIESFLLNKRGFCQQFAGTFAAMARSLGLPARVAVGFTQGLLGNDGRYHVFGRNAHAWPEVWFDSAGWVAFEPTPGRGSGDSTDYNGVPFAQDDTVSGGSGEGGQIPGDIAGSTTTPLVTSAIEDGSEGRNTGPGDTSLTTVAPSGTGGGGNDSTSALPFVLLGSTLALLTWIAFAPRVIRSRATRHAGSPPQRVIGAWHRTLGSLVMAGAPRPAGATPLEYATVAERSTGIDHHILREMATHVTRTVYSQGEITEQAASRCETLSREVIGICRDRTPLLLRLKALIDPRLMRLRQTG